MTGPKLHTKDGESIQAADCGAKFMAAREAAGLSQKSLAKRLGVKSKTIAGWENDLSEPRANRLQMLAGLLNVSLMWLLMGEGDGVDLPDGAAADAAHVKGVLAEIRELRAAMTAMTGRLGRLEKKLRQGLDQSAA